MSRICATTLSLSVHPTSRELGGVFQRKETLDAAQSETHLSPLRRRGIACDLWARGERSVGGSR